MRITRGVTAAGLLAASLSLAPSHPAGAAGTAPRVVQIVAHEDDDLLFMNPDVANSVTSGIDTLSVYLTAGENRADATPDPSVYAQHRQAGIRAAYAQMAGVSGCSGSDIGDGGCWTENTDAELVGPNGKFVQRFTLDDNPSVRLAFLDLPDNADARYPSGVGGGNTLHRLLDDPTLSTDALDMGGRNQPADAYQYSSSDIVDVLTTLLTEDNATLVRAQDSSPDVQLWQDLPDHDHNDHIAASRFADLAVGSYGSKSNPRVLMEHYRDYNIAQVPPNLMASQAADKHHTFTDVYEPFDDLLPDVPSDGFYQQWQQAEYSRIPRSPQAVIADSSKRLHAFAVEGGSLWEWAEDAQKVWHGPFAHGNPGGPLSAGLSTARQQDGRIEVFAQRADTGEIVGNVAHSGDNGSDWESLGNPNTGDGVRLATTVSSPAVAANGDGRLQVFVRDDGGGVSTLTQTAPNSGWGQGWTGLGGQLVQGPPAATTTTDGRIELFAATPQAVLHWYQPAPNTNLTSDNQFPSATPAGGLTVGADATGRLELLFRQPSSADIMTLAQSAPGGSWNSPVDAYGNGGVGEPAVATTGNGTLVIAERNRNDGVSAATQPGTDQSVSSWTNLGATIIGVPAAAVDRDGLVALIGIAPDGSLSGIRQNPDGTFPGWRPLVA